MVKWVVVRRVVYNLVMKIFVTASKQFYDRVTEIVSELEALGHEATAPNGFDEPEAENKMRELTNSEYQNWKAEMIKEDGRIVKRNDAILVVNFKKKGVENYIGGSTFLEMFKAFDLGKKIFLYNEIPIGMLEDEIKGFGVVVINGDLSLIR